MRRWLVVGWLATVACGQQSTDPFEGEYVGTRGPQVQLRTVGTVTLSALGEGMYELTAQPALACSPIRLEVHGGTLLPAAGPCAASGQATVVGAQLDVQLDAITFTGVRR